MQEEKISTDLLESFPVDLSKATMIFSDATLDFQC
jgi:hypothetical protein